MHRDPVSGILLMVGAMATVAVAALHPTGHDMLSGPPGALQVGVLIHALALASLPVLFLGFLGLSRSLDWSDLGRAALVAYGFGVAATIGAAVASGFVATGILERIRGGETAEIYHVLGWYTHLFNQGFATVGSFAAATSILLWSLMMARRAGAIRIVGIAGVVIGGGVLLGLLTGKLRLDVHGFAVMTIAKAAWIVSVGWLLVRKA